MNLIDQVRAALETTCPHCNGSGRIITSDLEAVLNKLEAKLPSIVTEPVDPVSATTAATAETYLGTNLDQVLWENLPDWVNWVAVSRRWNKYYQLHAFSHIPYRYFGRETSWRVTHYYGGIERREELCPIDRVTDFVKRLWNNPCPRPGIAIPTWAQLERLKRLKSERRRSRVKVTTNVTVT